MRSVERPDTPAQGYAGLAGFALLALGVLALIFATVDFGTVGPPPSSPSS